jgi:CRP-like cAMP-binding protein/ferredoxin
VREIAAGSKRLRYTPGSTVFNAGDRGDALYVVENGRVEVLVQTTPGIAPTAVAVLGPGECFGEMALLSGEPRSATVRAVDDVLLLRVSSEDFAALVSDADVYRNIIGLLCQRLRSTGERVEESERAQLALSRYLGGYRRHHALGVTGTSAGSRRLADAVGAAAASDGPVFIQGEPGTGKGLVAALIVRGGTRSAGPLIAIDCAAPGGDAASDIFGHEAGAVPGSPTRQLGALELCEEGTLVVAEPQALSIMFQQQLIAAIRSGAFRRIGGTEDIPLKARVIISRRIPPQGEPMALSPEFAALFTGGQVIVPTLMDRRRDVPTIAEEIIAHNCQELGIEVTPLTSGALERLLVYNWPGNVDELDSVLRRAISLSAGGPIEADHILIHLPSTGKADKIDLFRIPIVVRFFKSRWYPLVLQVPTAALLGWIVYLCFFGPDDDTNIALTLTWPVWWALLPFMLLAAQRVWCTICPFSLVSSLVQKVYSANVKVPEFLKKTEIWPMTGLFIFLTWADEFWHYPDHPRMTAVVLLGVFAGTLLCSLIFERRVWCRYLCPLGGVNGVYSSASLTELRPNTDVCANHCRGHECVAKDSPLACPMLERPLVVDNNRGCNLCMNCVKVCPNDAIHLYVRRPGSEVWECRRPMFSAGVLSILLASVMVVHSFAMWAGARGGFEALPVFQNLGMSGEQLARFAWTAVYFAGLFGVASLALVFGAVSSLREKQPFGSNIAHYGMAFAILAVIVHLAIVSAELFGAGIPKVLALLSGLVRTPAWTEEQLALFTPLFIRVLQLLMILGGIALTWGVVVKVARQRRLGQDIVGSGPHLAMTGLVGFACLGLIALSGIELPAPSPPADAAATTESSPPADTGGTPPADAAAPGAAQPGAPGPGTGPGKAAPATKAGANSGAVVPAANLRGASTVPAQWSGTMRSPEGWDYDFKLALRWQTDPATGVVVGWVRERDRSTDAQNQWSVSGTLDPGTGSVSLREDAPTSASVSVARSCDLSLEPDGSLKGTIGLAGARGSAEVTRAQRTAGFPADQPGGPGA